MYDETCYYDTHDPNNGGRGLALEEDLKLSSYSLEQHQTTEAANLKLDHELNAHLMQDMPLPPNWESKLGQDMQYTQQQQQQIDLQCFNPPPPPYGHTPTPDLLNLFHLPRCSILPNSSISFANPNILGEAADRSRSSVAYDSHLHLDLPTQQTPIFKDLFHSLPHNYGGSSSSTCFFGGDGNGMGIGIGMDERDDANVGAFYHDGDGNSMLNFSRDMSMPKAEGKVNRQHFATERQRREQLNGKYTALRTLVPNPTKGDRASIVHDAIEYIKELLRTVDELKILVDKKRYGMERCKRRKTEEDAAGDMESSSLPDRDQSNGTSRGTWLKRKSKETEVDVRIIEDEVTIKLIQRKKLNCLLSVSKILDELQLDLLHVSGGNIGNSNCFLFNTKIFEGSSVHACAIANKLIEAVDKNYAAAYEPNSF